MTLNMGSTVLSFDDYCSNGQVSAFRTYSLMMSNQEQTICPDSSFPRREKGPWERSKEVYMQELPITGWY